MLIDSYRSELELIKENIVCDHCVRCQVDVGQKPSLESEIKRAVFFLQAAQQQS